MVNMQKDIEEIKVMLKEIVKSLPTTYVSKDELIPIKSENQANKFEIQEIKATHNKVITWLIGTVGTIFLAFLVAVAKVTIFK